MGDTGPQHTRNSPDKTAFSETGGAESDALPPGTVDEIGLEDSSGLRGLE
jgi:hypothetical protein